MKDRLIWADQAKGFGIFLVLYAHNNPFLESYIYSFHMPLFFFIGGMFHPSKTSFQTVLKRAKSILIPYFVWSFILFVFWFFLGRHYGDSLKYNLDPLNGVIGLFYAQGDRAYMDWGIPMWFLPCIFLTFLLFSFVKTITLRNIQYVILFFLISFGFLYPLFFDFKLPWSIDVACVSLIFYSAGNFLKMKLVELKSKKLLIALIVVLFLITFLSFLNLKIDMYRSTYGNIPLFILNGFAGSVLVILFFKLFNFPKFLTFLGQSTIPLLALQFRAVTMVKFVLICFGIVSFNFDELTKFILVFVQILLIWPVIVLVNKYAPILNGNT